MRPSPSEKPLFLAALLLIVGSTGALGGCRPGASSSGQPEASGPVASDAGTSDVASMETAVGALPGDGAEDLGAPYLIREAKLERFIQYQERTLALYAQMLLDLAQVEGADGGPAESVAVVKRHAEAQERARRSLGLTERDVRELERVVGDVISRRSAAGGVDPDEEVKKLEALAEKLGPEQRVELDRTLEGLRAQQRETLALTEERRKYGDRNVDLVLSREEVLTAQWNRAISTFSGGTSIPNGAAPAPAGETDAGSRPVAGSSGP